MSKTSFGTCRDCEIQFVWLKTRKDKWVGVEQSTYHGEELFDPKIHQLHWKNCPNAKEYKSRKEEPEADDLSYKAKDVNCRKCNKPCVWLVTRGNEKIPVLVESDSYEGGKYYNSRIHERHIPNCTRSEENP